MRFTPVPELVAIVPTSTVIMLPAVMVVPAQSVNVITSEAIATEVSAAGHAEALVVRSIPSSAISMSSSTMLAVLNGASKVTVMVVPAVAPVGVVKVNVCSAVWPALRAEGRSFAAVTVAAWAGVAATIAVKITATNAANPMRFK